MSQYIIKDCTKTVGVKTLFQHVNFTINTGNKIGLIGVNGTGKSTLLAILAEKEEADQLLVERPNDYRIAYLAQDTQFVEGKTVMETVFTSDAPLIQLNLAYEEAMKNLQLYPEQTEAQERFTTLQQQMDVQDAWDINAKARTILTKLGIHQFDQVVDQLSGGQQKRVALAQVLLEPADLLLLDEPTNHLDVESIEWLQEELAQRQCAIVFVTHDRYFLDAVATHIYEIANQQLYVHRGNYGDFLEAKALREEMDLATEAKQKNRYRNELKWIRRGAQARSTKQKARIQRFDQLTDDLQKNRIDEELDIQLKTTRLGRKVIEAENISKSYDDRMIIKDCSFLLQTGDRIAVVGPNGVGKSTLLNLIAGLLEPDTGKIEQGSTVKVAYFQQKLPQMNENERMIDYIREASNDIEDANGVRISASQMLERFLFPTRVHGSLIGKLSGGERKRLYLLRLLMEQPNVLLLDEPTNDLDLETLSVVESFIDTFPGVVLTISHDRFFLDRTCKKLWVLDGSGTVEAHLMFYTEYIDRFLKNKENRVSKVQESAKEIVEQAPQKKKLSYNERKEWENIEVVMQQLEETIEQTEEEMANCGSDYEHLSRLTEQLNQVNAQYEQTFERWTYLQQIVDET